jgi:PiT family inorganic phosphate transporter
MDNGVALLVLVVVIALVFDFTNGFHDTANSIATMVGTRALDPKKAVIMAAGFNFIGAFWSLEVAATVGKGIINPETATLTVVLAGLTGAISWNLFTWYIGLPSSSSHALVGGLIGAAIAYAGTTAVNWQGVVQKVAIPSLLAPALGFTGAMILMAILLRAAKNAKPARANHLFRRAQIFSGAWLSFAHGTNDAQKTMGIIGLALLTQSGGSAEDFEVPIWVVFSAASAMALGTYAGGWKIIKTLGGKVVKMSPVQGFSASVGAAAILQMAEQTGVPVSTTHTVSGAVMGSGAAKRFSAVRWTVAGEILTAWVCTLPCAAMVGAMAFFIASISPVVMTIMLATGVIFLRRANSMRPVAAH